MTERGESRTTIETLESDVEWPMISPGLRVINDTLQELFHGEKSLNMISYAGKEIIEVSHYGDDRLLGIRHGQYRFVFSFNETDLVLHEAGNLVPNYDFGPVAGIVFTESDRYWEDRELDPAIIGGVAHYLKTFAKIYRDGGSFTKLEAYKPLLAKLDEYSSSINRLIVVDFEPEDPDSKLYN